MLETDAEQTNIDEGLARSDQRKTLRDLASGFESREKDWRRTAGTFPRDAITLEAERLGRQWRETACQEEGEGEMAKKLMAKK